MLSLTEKQIVTELLEFYTIETLSDLSKISHVTINNIRNNNSCSNNTKKLLIDFFNYHCNAFSFEATIPELYSDESIYLVNTPDGYQQIGEFVKKLDKKCFRINTKNHSIECAENHLIQKDLNDNDSWIMAKDLLLGQKVCTISGDEEISEIIELESQSVYDMSILHKNHRYWAGGFSNHNTYKSSIVQKVLANAQKAGLTPIIFDTENAIDNEGAMRLGLDTSKVKYIPTFNIEKCRNDIFKFLNVVKEKGLEGKFIIAIDSLGNLQSAMETTRMEKDSTSMDMGSRARAIGSLLTTCTQLAGLTKTPIIMTNHLYDNPGDLHPTLVKNMPGGKKCVYLPSVSVQLMRKPVKADAVKGNAGELAAGQRNYVGIVIRALTAKNRFVKQYLEGEMFISFSNGADKYHGLLDLAVELGVIQQAGATYSIDGEKLGYAKSFAENSEFWEDKIIPLMQKKIDVNWAYSSEQDTEIKKMEAEASDEGGEDNE